MKEERKKRRYKVWGLLLLIIIVSALPTIQSVGAETIPHYHDGMNLHPDENQQERYMPDPVFDIDVDPAIYRYEGVWPVYIKKSSDSSSFKGNYEGNMGFIRPVDLNPGDGVYPNYSLGRTFIHKSTLGRWGKAFNGNMNYVEKHAESVSLMRQSDKKAFSRIHSVELARVSGANVKARKDTSGNDYLEVITTSFPVGSIRGPSSAKSGEKFNVEINAEEFNPYSQFIKYEIYKGNTLLKSGVEFKDNISNIYESISIGETGKHVLTLKVSDGIERTTTVTTVINIAAGDIELPPEPEENPNLSPIADVNVEPSYYWVEEVPFQDNSYDPDGEIISRNLTVDGQPSSNPKKFSRVTEIEDHSVELMVTDDRGASDTDSAAFKILPTTPKAEFSITGTTKVNRKISLDGTLSNKVSPVHVAPIDYSLSNWTIKPLTDGVTQQDILIQNSSDRSKRDFLVRKPGEYEITLTVTNNYGETSEPATKTITVQPDRPPLAQFTVDAGKAIRDKSGEKNATITLTDSSISPDEDKIKQRIYYVDFDSNNDGFFGTPQDEPKRIISNKNETKVQFKANKVGNYRFSLEVIEEFGQETLPEFIQEEHYLRDSSGVLDKSGEVATYQEPNYFNLPEYDKSVEIINVNPVIDFGVRRQNKIDVVLNFGGMDTATHQHQTGTRPGAGINNGGGGGTYDHYYYTFDEADKNRLSSYASTMEANLLAKGIDANVTINNAYYRQLDADGVGVRNVPVWGWRDYGSYQYSNYSGTTPYSGDWEVTSSSSTPIYEVTWCYYDGSAHGGKIHSHPPPCSDSSNEILTQTGTLYTASLRKYFPDYRFEVVSYQNEGLNSTEQVNTTDFTDAYASQTYRPGAQNLYLRMDKKPWDWMNNTSKVNLVTNKSKSNNIFFWNMAVVGNRTNAERIINGGIGIGQFSIYDSQYLNKNVKDVEDYIINKYFMEEDGVNTTIVLGDKLDYTVNYTDHENDPELKREWKFTHDPTKINGRLIDNAPASPIPQSGLYIDSPLQLTQVGTYRVQLRAQDDPVYDGDERFFNYRKWSDEEVQREYIINVHRRPIADFTYSIDPGTLDLSLDPSISYDLDHQFNRPDKGIVEHKWVSYSVDGNTYNGAPPARLAINKDYDVTLQVKDIYGAYGVVTKRISTQGYNIKPVALFDAPDIVVDTMDLNIVDRSYDPNGDPLTDYRITVRKQGDTTILRSLTEFPNSFKEMGLGAGNYIVSLTVRDIPNIPPSLTSDPYERTIKVIENKPPVSNFKLTPAPLVVNEINNYQDLSSDPDGHPLKNYSWTIEKLDEENNVTQTWNTGVPPRDWREYGIGTFRVTQTVFDDPPYPLPSLSGTHSEVVEVVMGPLRPFALFDYTPKPAIEGNNIKLDPDKSFDPDGTVQAWEWTIKAPNGTTTTSSSHYPMINNAVVGTYEVTLHVRDNDNLRSRVPSIQDIIVQPKPPNLPPVATFIWDPFKPFLGESVQLDPDGSYDLDGEIVAWKWTIKADNGSIQSSSQKKPTFIARTERYDVTLEVTDNNGSKDAVTETIIVDIAALDALVTHTPEWNRKWMEEGFPSDINIFHAGEKFVIQLTSTPAQRVWGSVHFGGKVGKVDIPSTKFKLISKNEFEYTWEAELWREDFIYIEEGQYMFDFGSIHPVDNPRVEAAANYLIEIRGNVYSELNFHRNH